MKKTKQTTTTINAVTVTITPKTGTGDGQCIVKLDLDRMAQAAGRYAPHLLGNIRSALALYEDREIARERLEQAKRDLQATEDNYEDHRNHAADGIHMSKTCYDDAIPF